QICVSLMTWIIGKKLNRSVKQYVGNVMSNYIATARVRPHHLESGKRKATVGDKLGRAKDRFLRTIETLTLTNDEAMRRAAEMDDYVVDTKDITERFENDYVPSEVDAIPEEEQKKKPKRTKLNVKKDKRILTKKEKPSVTQKKVRVGKLGKSQEQAAQFEDIVNEEQVASDVTQDDEIN
ncbi:MAG: hypothetical protein K2I23_01040, partial [Clostridia bacterium]|nr:hypothetical protein [Clostridia bacterium]